MPNPTPRLSNIPGFKPVDGRQENFIRMAEGIGKVRTDGKGLSLAMNIFDTDGKPDGTQICSGEVTGVTGIGDFTKQPKNEPVKFGELKAIPEVPITSICKATWTFDDGSSISAIGKGTSHIVPLKPDARSLPAGPGVAKAGLMADATNMIVTKGTGRFAGARGTVTLDSSVFLPDLNNVPFGTPGAEVHQKSIHTFHIFRAADVG